MQPNPESPRKTRWLLLPVYWIVFGGLLSIPSLLFGGATLSGSDSLVFGILFHVLVVYMAILATLGRPRSCSSGRFFLGLLIRAMPMLILVGILGGILVRQRRFQIEAVMREETERHVDEIATEVMFLLRGNPEISDEGIRSGLEWLHEQGVGYTPASEDGNPRDVYGNKFKILRTVDADRIRVDCTSAGPDGIFGNDDDVSVAHERTIND